MPLFLDPEEISLGDAKAEQEMRREFKPRPKYFNPPDDDFFLQFLDPVTGSWDDDQTAYADGEY